jgi:hypothetical protein
MKDTIELAREAGNDDLFDAMQVAFLERFEALVRADERKNFCAALRQMHDAYSLASNPSGLKVRGGT